MNLFDVYKKYAITPVSAEDVYVYDANNRAYLDLYGGHAVISIGHSHPQYVKNLRHQLEKIAFYSNVVENPLQNQLASKLVQMSNCEDYKLFLCNSGAEANENALKLASFHTKRDKMVAFKHSFHGRTSAAVAVTDNKKIIAPVNANHKVEIIETEDIEQLEKVLEKKDIAAVIVEVIQGVGGLNESSTNFYQNLQQMCKKYGTIFIADEVQSGFGRTGDFFAFQKHSLQPHIISMAKGMGNGFPVGGILVHPNIQSSYGLLGTTFGGNHLACVASLTVLEVIKHERLMQNALKIGQYFKSKVESIATQPILKGRGLMLGVAFDFDIANLRKNLIFNHRIFTGNSANPNLLRILPPLTIKQNHIDKFIEAVNIEIKQL